MPSFTVVLFVFFLMGQLSLGRAHPVPERARQVAQELTVPQCTLACANQVAPLTAECLPSFSACLSASCAAVDFTSASAFMSGYCNGHGIVRSIDGVLVTLVAPAVATTSSVPETQQPQTTTVVVTEYVTLAPSAATTEPTPSSPTTTSESSSTLFSASSASSSASTSSTSLTNPLRTTAAIPIYVVISLILFVFVAFYVRYWRRKRQGDFIIPTHRSSRGKSFLIDGEPFKNLYMPDSIELTNKFQPTSTSSSFDIKPEDRPLPAVPIPTKSSHSAPSLLSSLVTTTTHAAPRNYVALPGQAAVMSPTTSPVDVRTSPGLEGSPVARTFAAGLERARNVLGHTSPVSPSSSGSPTPSPTSPSGSATNGDVYAALSKAPMPAYSYQPAAPSPLRSHIGPSRVYSTIIEEPRTPHSATSLSSSAAAPPLPSIPVSQMHSTVSTAQRGRPSFAAHVRNPRSNENLRSFTFPQKASNDIELQITISDAMRDDGVPVDRERSETPSGSMHRGAGGSVSSVKGRLQALVGGIRKERE